MARSEEEVARRREIIARIIEKYGSEDAVFAPCDRERMILDAVAPWREASAHPSARRTRSLVPPGELEEPPQILKAIAEAYPMPATIREAKAEIDHWGMREREFEALLHVAVRIMIRPGLDRPAWLRRKMVRALARNDLPVTGLADLAALFDFYREDPDQAVEDKIALAFEILVRADADREAEGDVRVAQKVASALMADPAASDRAIARTIGCSPTTVGKVRQTIDLASPVRTVQRGGRTYAMKKAAPRPARGEAGASSGDERP